MNNKDTDQSALLCDLISVIVILWLDYITLFTYCIYSAKIWLSTCNWTGLFETEMLANNKQVMLAWICFSWLFIGCKSCRFVTWSCLNFPSTVELRWLELVGTVGASSTHQCVRAIPSLTLFKLVHVYFMSSRTPRYFDRTCWSLINNPLHARVKMISPHVLAYEPV